MNMKIIDILNDINNNKIDKKKFKAVTIPFYKIGYVICGELNISSVYEALEVGALELDSEVKVIKGIIEKPKPLIEKFESKYTRSMYEKELEDKINEVIDYINSKGSDE